MLNRSSTLCLLRCAVCCLLAGMAGHNAPAQIDSARGGLPPLRHLDSEFLFQVPADVQEWQRRKEQLRNQLLVSLGLDPLPTRHPLKAVIHGRIDCGDYSIEHVYFESWPGFNVTGNLYRPKGVDRPVPGVLCPHGHWRNGRFLWASDQDVQRELDSGAETFESNARSVLQARCIHLARMGCVVFHYDMLGYADSQQISYAVAHGFSERRPHMETEEQWGLFSPRAELELISVMGLQTWNSIRALDFLESLADVDPRRLAVTGASGGGTQTFILCAIDDRPQVAFPAVMVSTAMQGGCTCENCCGLRLDGGNVDFAAMFAPRPLGLTAADDWTRDMAHRGYPELRALYTLLGQPDHVSLTSRLEFGHNFNQVSREAMYAWFHKHLGLAGEPPKETAIEVRRPEALTVYNEEYLRPPGGDGFESYLVAALAEDSRRQLGLHADSTASEFEDSFPTLENGWRTIVGHRSGDIAWEPPTVDEHGWLSSSTHGVKTPMVRWTTPDQTREEGEPAAGVLCFGARGAGLESIRDAIAAGLIPIDGASVGEICGIDLAFQGVLSVPETERRDHMLVPNGRLAAGYTFGYNRSVAAWRVTQILDAVTWLRSRREPTPCSSIVVVADEESAPEVLVAAVLAKLKSGDVVVVELGDFRFRSVNDLTSLRFLPGAVRYGDVETLQAILRHRGVTLKVTPARGGTQPGISPQEPGLQTQRQGANGASRRRSPAFLATGLPSV